MVFWAHFGPTNRGYTDVRVIHYTDYVSIQQNSEKVSVNYRQKWVELPNYQLSGVLSHF